jgi:hypothetical protein
MTRDVVRDMKVVYKGRAIGRIVAIHDDGTYDVCVQEFRLPSVKSIVDDDRRFWNKESFKVMKKPGRNTTKADLVAIMNYMTGPLPGPNGNHGLQIFGFQPKIGSDPNSPQLIVRARLGIGCAEYSQEKRAWIRNLSTDGIPELENCDQKAVADIGLALVQGREVHGQGPAKRPPFEEAPMVTSSTGKLSAVTIRRIADEWLNVGLCEEVRYEHVSKADLVCENNMGVFWEVPKLFQDHDYRPCILIEPERFGRVGIIVGCDYFTRRLAVVVEECDDASTWGFLPRHQGLWLPSTDVIVLAA